jgi:hypothetical protein
MSEDELTLREAATELCLLAEQIREQHTAANAAMMVMLFRRAAYS